MAIELQETSDVQTASFIDTFWDQKILPALKDYVKIRCVSRNYSTDWKTTLPQAAEHARTWVQGLGIPGATVKVEIATDRTPFLLIDLPGTVGKTALLYGHFDKQPPGPGWTGDPWTPKVVGGKLYGRGAADDGYALFAAVAAMESLRKQGGKRCRTVICIELDEESGSQDFPYYLDKLAKDIGDPGLLVFLDSGAGTYDRLWLTTSLRGILNLSLAAKVLTAAVHSGGASGIIPDPVRILRILLSRLENTATGAILSEGLQVEIPEARKKEAAATAKLLGAAIYKEFPLVTGLKPVTEDLTQLYLNRSWRPQLTVLGQNGLPPTASAGNVIQPSAELKLSLRLPPTLNAAKAEEAVRQLLTQKPPYDSQVEVKDIMKAEGWNAETAPKWLADALAKTSQTRFGQPVQALQEGGSIGVLKMLEQKYKAPFVVTGVLGPGSNAHGPNESLDIPYAKKLTGCVADLVSAFSNT